MPRSASPKSQLGKNGPEDKDLSPEENSQPTVETEDCEKPVTPESPVPDSPDVAVADVSDKNTPSFSPYERKLADKMSREIARHLGLSGSSRSVRIK
jgi:hypothetical protein